jgi:hypothetical protein
MADHTYWLATGRHGEVGLYLDHEAIGSVANVAAAVDWLLGDITRAVADASAEHLLFHAGGVQHGDMGVLLPAPSGGGKSTTVAGLVHWGFGYLSDELIALDTSTRRILPFPKPLTIKSGSFDAVRALAPALDPAGHLELRQYVGPEWNIPVDWIRPGSVGVPCPLGLVVVPHFVGGGRTVLEPLSADDAFLALALNTVNLDRLGGPGAVMVHDLVHGCDCYRLEISDLAVACHLMHDLVTQRHAPLRAEAVPSAVH